ncbi:sugar transferase [Roseococcus sp. DSY-14]|uniref:sugar transferase n=1 Tax=Roseococcus sp. DSY-14 TaxID=3369650 RepID=UPI00387AF9F8
MAKRGFDILGALALGALLGLPCLLAALGVRLFLGPGVLFRQVRAGRGGAPFAVLKLRSMRHGPGADAQRLTRFGRWLRASALDEVPQLWNVLRGEMSLVGPRPLPLDYLPLYSAREASRLRVRPGLCGLAQAEGRNAVGWDRRLELDARYVETMGLGADLRIIARCAAVVLRGAGRAPAVPLSEARARP